MGIDQLLEMILLQAEVMELRANPDKPARGHVVEAKIDSGRGPVATVLVSEGTLHTGDPIVCGVHYGKIRAMLDDRGQAIETAGPSIPVEILGLSGVPVAGDEFAAVPDERAAKQISLHRMQKQRARDLSQTNRPSLESLFERLQQGDVKDLNLIIKADVHGSIEALSEALTKLSNQEVKVNVVHAATGTISESDVSLATVSQAIIIGFNVRPTPKVQALAAEENVDMRFYTVIYDVINDVKSAMTGLMASRYEERFLGSAEVREVFMIPKIGAVAGSYVTDGWVERGRNLRLVRDGVVVFEGKNSSLRRFKDDVKEVQSGYECGIGIENFNDIKVGDRIEFYYMEEIKPEVV
jgi:translation initiation factor IF-2